MPSHTSLLQFVGCLACISDSPQRSISDIHVCRGVIGPTRQFGPHALYKPELYALVAGALLPIPFWLWQRRYPQSWLKYFSMPVLLNGPGSIPPALGINYSSWFVVAFIFRKCLTFCSSHQHHLPCSWCRICDSKTELPLVVQVQLYSERSA